MTQINIVHGIRPRPVSQAIFLFTTTFTILFILVLAITTSNRDNALQYTLLFALLPSIVLGLSGYIYADLFLKQRIQFVEDRILLGRKRFNQDVDLRQVEQIEFQFKGIPQKLSVNSQFPEIGQLKVFIHHTDGKVQSFSFYNWQLSDLEDLMDKFNEFYDFLHQHQSTQNSIISWAYKPTIKEETD